MARKSREKAKAGAGGKVSPLYVVLGVVGVIGIGALGYTLSSSSVVSGAVSEPVEVEGLDDPARLVELAQGVTRGDPSSPIKIVEFGDYQCPGCGNFARMVKPRVDMAYIDAGQAHFTFYDFPLIQIHPHAFLAARAARCAGDQEMYWQYHDALFANQPTWSGSTSPGRLFSDYAETVGLDVDAFQDCLNSDRHADVVTANMQLGLELGVSGTPTIMISEGQGMARRTGSDFESIAEAIAAYQQGG